MSRFFYRVRTGDGEILQDYISASTIADAAVKLEQKGFVVLEIKEEVRNSDIKTFNSSTVVTPLTILEKKEFFNSFYFLYKSGLSVFEIFKSILNSSKNGRIKTLCLHIIKSISQGKSLKESLKNCSNALGLAYAALIASGEESGRLEEVLSGIIKNINKTEEIKSNLISSLTYPVSVFFLAIAVAMLFKFFIFEVFSLRSQSYGQIDTIGLLIAALIKIVIIFAVIFAVLFYIYKNKSLMNKIISFILDIRIFGSILKCYYFSNFFSVLSLAYESGIPVSEGVILANSVIKNPEIHKKIKKTEKMVQEGCELATALGVTELFTGYAISQISAGEKAGELDKVLKTAAHDYENHLDNAIKVMLKLVEPVMIIFVGILVAVIAVNGYRAYYNSILSMF